MVDAEVSGGVNDFGTSILGDTVAFGLGGPDLTLQSELKVADDGWHHVAAVRTVLNIEGTLQIELDI